MSSPPFVQSTTLMAAVCASALKVPRRLFQGRGHVLALGPAKRIAQVSMLYVLHLSYKTGKRNVSASEQGETPRFLGRVFKMVRDRGFEPLTPSVSRKCSTTELTARSSR